MGVQRIRESLTKRTEAKEIFCLTSLRLRETGVCFLVRKLRSHKVYVLTKKKLLLNSYENYKVPESKNAKSVLNIEVGITVYFSYPIFYGFGLICLCVLRYGLPWCLSGNELACQCRRCEFDPLVEKIPWRRQPTPVLLPGKTQGQRNLEGYSPRGCKGHDLATKQQHTSILFIAIHVIVIYRYCVFYKLKVVATLQASLSAPFF